VTRYAERTGALPPLLPGSAPAPILLPSPKS